MTKKAGANEYQGYGESGRRQRGRRSWDVINPETLKDHVGHHVELSAHVYKDKGQIHVMKVAML